jgi:hypothetical protein
LSRLETDFTDNTVIALSLSRCVTLAGITQCIGSGHTRTLADAETLGRKRQTRGHERTAAKNIRERKFFRQRLNLILALATNISAARHPARHKQLFQLTASLQRASALFRETIWTNWLFDGSPVALQRGKPRRIGARNGSHRSGAVAGEDKSIT